MDCGPTCLRMIAKFYGKHYNPESIRSNSGFSKEGVSLLGLSEAAEKIGFRTRGVQISFNQISNEVTLPCILHWDQNHFVVAFPNAFRKSKHYIIIADPSKGVIRYTKNEFLQKWISTKIDNGDSVGTALLLEPCPEFYDKQEEKNRNVNWSFLLRYLPKNKWQIGQVIISLIIASILQFIFPFLTQSIVDTGINTQNLHFLTIILIAQLMLVFTKTFIEFIRSRLLLNISTNINLSILSDFWIKICKLPINYFDSHHTGDTLQRIGDQKNIQNFLTGTSLSTLFSLFNFIVFGCILTQYNLQILLVFILGSILYYLWVTFFLVVRRKINYETFHLSAKENNATLQLVQGMQEIKLNNAEKIKRWEWEDIQVSIFKLNFKTLTYSQIQQTGALLINQGKDLVLTFLVASYVIDGKLTLGSMLAIQYIIGQLSGPIEQFVNFAQSMQDTKISFERLNEIHQLNNDENDQINYINVLPENKSISITNLNFTYPGVGNDAVLRNINLEIPEGKVIAIVGASGSGKTTLLKMLLMFYNNYIGEIKVGDTNFNYISPSFWRSKCGVVLQDGYIFNDSIAKNIAVGDENVNHNILIQSCKIACILQFIETLPNGFNTRLGTDGTGLSQGQKQRILIARAIYKLPHFLFLDESTNALDANNEKAIVENLQEFYKGKTVVIIAHRLSTVKNADKILVMQNGLIVEEGTHEVLYLKNGVYFELVKNQIV